MAYLLEQNSKKNQKNYSHYAAMIPLFSQEELGIIYKVKLNFYPPWDTSFLFEPKWQNGTIWYERCSLQDCPTK